jgi:hypothetical protein
MTTICIHYTDGSTRTVTSPDRKRALRAATWYRERAGVASVRVTW